MIKEDVLRHVTDFYLTSGDFNGIPVSQLANVAALDLGRLTSVLRELIEGEEVGLQFSDTNLNIHVLRLDHEEKGAQIAKLAQLGELQACVYPMPGHLMAIVDQAEYSGRPYTLALAHGEPQLSFRVFDSTILEFYRNDPRYEYSNDDVRGDISITSEYYESEQLPESDKILLQSFGICYDENLYRAVAVFLRYLAGLSSDHQLIWQSRELSGDFRLHPDYYQNSIVGDWGKGISVFDAFIQELRIINQMCDLMKRPRLFRYDFREGERPRGFGFLLRPTLREYNSFVLALDQLLSDGINRDFFQGEAPTTEEIQRKDGRIEIRNIGTIRMLEHWFRKNFRISDWEPINAMFRTLRKVRQLRQKPAHAIQEDSFDMKHFHDQRELIIEAFEAVNTLRAAFASHPLVRASDDVIPVCLEDIEIWTY